MTKYPHFTFSKPPKRTRKKKSRQSEPRTAPAINPLSAIDGDLAELKEAIQASTRQLRATTRPEVATDGKTVIDQDVKKRGEVVDIVGNQKLVKDPVTGISWIERLF